MDTIDARAFEILVTRNRSYRRFDESRPVSRQTLIELIELTRFCGSTSNIQALKFHPAAESAERESIFASLNWAGYLADWDGPTPGERPTGYIVILGDTELRASFGIDPGIVAQTMLLAAVARGFGGCMIGSIQRDKLRRSLGISKRYEIPLVVALGAPAETVVVEDIAEDGSVKYYRDADNVHHVPKRKLEEILFDPSR